MAADKEYLDAKFDGLAALMKANNESLTGYISGVNAAVKEVRKDLQDHKENSEAHGAGVSNRNSGNIVLWLSLVVSIVAVIAAFVPHKG